MRSDQPSSPAFIRRATTANRGGGEVVGNAFVHLHDARTRSPERQDAGCPVARQDVRPCLGVEKNTVTMAGSPVWKGGLHTFPAMPIAAAQSCKETEQP